MPRLIAIHLCADKSRKWSDELGTIIARPIEEYEETYTAMIGRDIVEGIPKNICTVYME